MKFEINYKERLYFGIMLVISFLAYSYLVYTMFLAKSYIYFYIIAFLLFRLLSSLFLIGYIKGNAIKISKEQFPDIFDILQNHSQILGLKKTPDMYVLQGNGVLNAFATRFSRKNFVVLYSDIFEMAYEEGKDAVSFIIGHELGHIKRNHVGFIKSILILPAHFIPFLNTAYSRACEYTCDNVGYNLSAKGATSGLLILAAGKKLYKKIDLSNLINNAKDRPGFAFWFSELFFTHPHLIKRLAVLNKLNRNNLDLENIDFIIPKVKFKGPEIQH
ncbi:M48 family peptidase [Candidatus Dependentiae bacterium]|nr:MAG: M48 family peptidase [Candidatus Dependentiae bacterium]